MLEASAVVIAISLVLQLVVWVVIAFGLLRALRAIVEIAQRLDRELHPIVLDVQEITGNVKGMVHIAQRNIWRVDMVGERLIGNAGLAVAAIRRVMDMFRSRRRE